MNHLAKGFGIGQPVRRLEDQRLVTGKGRFSDDMNLPGQVHAIMLRSPHAHARIKSIDTAPALQVPGVLLVLTGKDQLDDGLKPIPHTPLLAHPAEIKPENTDGTPIFTAPHYPLAIDKVRYVGEAVAIVIATSIAAAKDGAERVEVDYEPLPAVTDTAAAAEPDAPKLFDQHHSNVCLDAELGDRAATEAAFARAAHTVKFETWVQRITGAPMEPRAAVSEYDPKTRRYTLYAGSGGAVRLKNDLATVLAVPSEQVRVIIHDVGGNFGTRGMIYPEFCLVAWAARRAGRPVKWLCERSEAFLCDYQGRDLVVSAELALDADGTFLAMRGSNIGNAGAHTTNFSPLQKGVEIMSSIYRMPAAHFRARAVLSNTSPTRPYRSAGRPEVMFVMERLIDLACRDYGFDRVEIRRRNLITPSELPYRNPFGMHYDSGHYQEVMDWALDEADWAGFEARRAEARKRGKYRGISIGNYVDTATGQPRERTEITVRPDGWVDVVIGTVSNGQGHETTFAQLITEWFGVPIDRVRIITHDTDIVKVGGGTHSGRGMRLASLVMKVASDEIAGKARKLAALLLNTTPDDVAIGGGKLWAKGTDRTIGLFALAKAAEERTDLPEDLRGPLAAICDKVVKEAAFPYGAHVCELEIDPQLGQVEIVRYTTVDDAGRAVNPMVVHGQTHGGIAQGVGQALWEHCAYNAGTGQLMSGSFMDYAMPRADNFPFFNTQISEVPSPEHPLGIRPAGEGGTVPALAVVVNAIVDALSEFGVRHVEMPATAERIWRAMRKLPDPSPVRAENA
ncbi:MAG: xanthine dehydrogenase family protein molybdopterin-binding subunit [Pseudolabrys sp.]